jgi:hypothetical protein
MATYPKNIATVRPWTILLPGTIKKVREHHKESNGFLDLAGYYGKFMKYFGQISRPMIELLRSI